MLFESLSRSRIENDDATRGHYGRTMQLGAKATRTEETKTGAVRHLEGADGVGSVEGDLVPVSTGRIPNVTRLGLDDIGIAYDEKRDLRTDATGRTGQQHIYAGDDVGLGFQRTMQQWPTNYSIVAGPALQLGTSTRGFCVGGC